MKSSTRSRKSSLGRGMGVAPCRTPIALRNVPRATERNLKRAIDIVGSFVILVLSAPVLFAAAVLVKLTSRGPAFYAQTRLGRLGRRFTIYKLRTMVHNCEHHTGPIWARPDDPRITRFGRFLRRSHIDELPQLWNVLMGDMSLVGPRPERPEIAGQLEQVLPDYRMRLLVRPGVTGLAQLHLPADTCIASVQSKLTYDLRYVRNVCTSWDLKILVDTVAYLLGCRRPWTTPLCPSAGRAAAIAAGAPRPSSSVCDSEAA